MSTLSAPAARGRPSWSGLLRLSLVAVPVKAYAAVRTTSATHFNQLHAACGQRIRYDKRCPRHGPVDLSAIVRGYQYAPDQYVIVEPEELDQLRPAKDKALVLEQFVAVQDVDPVFFAGRSLFLLPDGVAARHPYGVLAAAMRQAGKAALGRVVLSEQRQLVLVRPVGRVLAVDVLHYPAQVRSATAWQAELPDSTAVAEELRLARQLMDTASSPLDWSRYRDTRAAELAALVAAKVAKQPPPAPAEEPAETLQLLEALKRSVATVKDQPRRAGAARSTRSPGRTSA
jgi:DNA end-binding protein Ku